jgi:hypothetical protein
MRYCAPSRANTSFPRSSERKDDLRSVRKVTLQPSSLSEVHSLPSEEVATIECQTILACSEGLADWHAYQITRILSELFKELDMGADGVDRIHDVHPGIGFNHPIHEGTARYYRHGKIEPFPHSTLVVAIGASIATFALVGEQRNRWHEPERPENPHE